MLFTGERPTRLLAVTLLLACIASASLAHVAAGSSNLKAPAKSKPAPSAPPGYQGATGPTGSQGTDAVPVAVQPIGIDWQNGAWAGNDSSTFTAPGIGTGVVTCSLDTQWVRFFPADPDSDIEMWATYFGGYVKQVFTPNEVILQAAGRRSVFYGPDFNLGLNSWRGQAQSMGSLVAIISDRGPFGALDGVGPAPTTLHLSWYWSFSDAYGPRCYVSGDAISEGD
jgi:hypothetical protein